MLKKADVQVASATTLQQQFFAGLMWLLLFTCVGAALWLLSLSEVYAEENAMQITMTVGDEQITLQLEDGSATRDWVSRLPMTVDLDNFGNGAEKIFYPSPELDKSDVRRDNTATAGTIAIFEPWGNVAIFLKSNSSAYGLIQLGRIDAAGIKVLQNTSATQATFSK